MKRLFLIDFENVSDSGLDGFCDLFRDDAVILFYTPKTGKISIDFIRAVQFASDRADLRFEKVSGGNQALDLQMSTYLGSILEDNTEYYIISKDKGYAYVVDFWKNKKPDVKIVLKNSIAECIRTNPDGGETGSAVSPEEEPATEKNAKKQPSTPSKPKQPKKGKEKRTTLNTQIQQTLSKAGIIDNAIISQTASIAVKNCENDNAKNVVQQELIKKFGQKNAQKH